MAFSGSTFSKLFDWIHDLWRGDNILRARLDAEFDGIATGLTTVGGVTVNATSTWTTYTPSISAASGTFTAVSASGRYKQVGKTVFIYVAITVTTNGTASGGVIATLPSLGTSPAATFHIIGRDDAVSGKTLCGYISGTTITILNYDNTYPAVNSSVLVLSGLYEIS